MTTAPDALLHRLEWTVLRRLDGRIQGGVRTSRRGSGLDFAGLRAYVEGDDARHIDWNVTARLDEPQLREFTEDRELTTWLVLDRSASMADDPASEKDGAARAGSAGTKQQLATELALVLARLLGRSGNRVGALLYDDGSVRVVTPGTGRRQALRIGREVERAPLGAARATTDLAAMLAAVSSLARRSLVVVVSDFIGTGAWERPLIKLAYGNEVVAIRVTDRADDALPAVGLIVVEDAETGEQLLVDSADPWFRARFRDGVDERDAALVAGTRRAGVPLHQVEVGADLIEALVSIVSRTRGARGRQTGSGRASAAGPGAASARNGAGR